MTRIVLIVNGDTEPRHFENVERALGVLGPAGYVRYVASPQRPVHAVDHYVATSAKTVRDLVARLQSQIDDDDELVIYTTGHGDLVKGEAHLCLKQRCESNVLPAALVNEIPYGSRTIVMDQCMAGNWGEAFLHSARTLFVAAGSRMEEVCCSEFAPRFWSADVPDLNHDGIVSFQERYAHVILGGISRSVPQFVPSRGYPFEGKAPFSTQVGTISTTGDLQRELSRLQPGQYAIVTYSTSWCTTCKTFRPRFEQQARDAGGHFLFLRSESESLALSLGISSFPTVVAYAHDGQHIILNKREDIFEGLAQFQVPDEIIAIRKLERKVQDAGRATGVSRAVSLTLIADDCKKLLADRTFSRLASLGKNVLRLLIGYPADIPDETGGADAQKAMVDFLMHYQSAIATIDSADRRADLQITLGGLMHELGFGTMAPAVLTEALKSASKTSFLVRIAESQIAIGDMRGARGAIDALLEKGDVEEGFPRAEALNAAALLLHRIGDVKTSEDVFDQAIQTAEPLFNDSLWSDIAMNLARAGQVARALGHFARIESSAGGKDLFSDRISALAVLAESMAACGLSAESRRVFDRALDTATRIADPKTRLSTLIDVARHLRRAQWTTESADAFKLAITTSDRIPADERIEKLNDLLRALPLISTSIPLLRDIERRIPHLPGGPEQTRLKLTLAEDLRRHGQDALPLLHAVLSEATTMDTLHGRILLLARIARGFKKHGEHLLAETTFDQAIRLCQGMVGAAKSGALISLAQAMLREDYREGALRVLREAQNTAQQDNNSDLQKQVNTLMVQYHLVSP